MGVLNKILGALSGGKEEKVSEQLLFDKVIGFRGVVSGVGCSTLVQNIAYALSDKTSMHICVLDTNIVYPAQETLLPSNKKLSKDIFDFAGSNISDIASKTRIPNVYTISFRDRHLSDMLSSRECQSLSERLFDELKTRFDVILVDLGHEPTWITTIAQIRCNRIYSIVTPDTICMTHLRNSLNEVASLAVPAFKLRRIILNKEIVDINSGVESTLSAYNLVLLTRIPFSIDIARYGVTSERIWASISNKKAVTLYNNAISSILDDILAINTTNQQILLAHGEKQEVQEEELDWTETDAAPTTPVPQRPAPQRTAPQRTAPQRPVNQAQMSGTPVPQRPVNQAQMSGTPVPQRPVNQAQLPTSPAPQKPAPQRPVGSASQRPVSTTQLPSSALKKPMSKSTITKEE